MKKLFLLALLVPVLCWGQQYRETIEAGDTLVGNTVDTTESVVLYSGANFDGIRPSKPTFFFDFDEIGSNTTHNFYTVIVDVADADLAKAADGWAEAGKFEIRDFVGYASGSSPSQNDFIYTFPYLDALEARYVRLRIYCPIGSSADSTAYAINYLGDKSRSQYTPPVNMQKTLSHYELTGSTSARILVGGTTSNSYIFDTRVEVSPGIYRKADEIMVGIYGSPGDNKVDDDSTYVYLSSYNYMNASNTYIDTLTMVIGSATSGSSGEASLNLSGGGDAVPEAMGIAFSLEGGDLNDSSYVFFNVMLKANP